MSILDTVKLWKNCLATLSDPTKYHHHNQAKHIKAAIGKEWDKRKRSVAADEYFAWPTTEALAGNGTIITTGWVTEGVLKFMGYQVGESSRLNASLRQAILAEIFVAVLPPIFPANYLEQFGQPQSSHRLQKLAETIAALTRNAKRRGSKMDTAIRDWERDLEFLYFNYYVARFSFGWPSTTTL